VFSQRCSAVAGDRNRPYSETFYRRDCTPATSGCVVHPTDIFDTEKLRLMSGALDAAASTRLIGAEPDESVRLSMAQRLIAAAAAGERQLTLAGAALVWLREASL
jgi:hypothetical protein